MTGMHHTGEVGIESRIESLSPGKRGNRTYQIGDNSINENPEVKRYVNY